jgi:dolichyl-phosphate-mannose--protein O-mannosyl transferase
VAVTEETEPAQIQNDDDATAEAWRRDWSRLDSLCLAIVTLIAGTLRLIRLDIPKKIFFDEVYYAKDACWYVNVSESVCGIDGESTPVHPPLGKWLLAVGIRIFGHDSFGWRISAAVAGTITVVLLYLLARKLLKSTLGATIAAGLLGLDFLHFVESRIAMLDIFVPLFGIAAVLFAVYDRDRHRGPDPVARNGPLDRPWRIAAGAAAGAAVASKWSGGFFILLVVVLTVMWEYGARRSDGEGRIIRRILVQELPTILLWLVVLPIAVYCLTYVGRLTEVTGSCPPADGSFFVKIWERQRCMTDFHRNLDSSHGYQSPAWSWLLIKRPVSYFYERDGSGNPGEIFASGNPFVWWASILALLFAAWRWVRNGFLSLRTPGGLATWLRPEGLILAGFVVTYAPWLLLSSERQAVFIFYLLPTVPFMCMALAYIATEIGNSWEAKAAVALFAAGTIGLFAFYYPLLANVPIPQEDWDRRIWIFKGSQCDKPPGTPETSSVTELRGNETVTKGTVTTSDANLPPKGWCWI